MDNNECLQTMISFVRRCLRVYCVAQCRSQSEQEIRHTNVSSLPHYNLRSCCMWPHCSTKIRRRTLLRFLGRIVKPLGKFCYDPLIQFSDFKIWQSINSCMWHSNSTTHSHVVLTNMLIVHVYRRRLYMRYYRPITICYFIVAVILYFCEINKNIRRTAQPHNILTRWTSYLVSMCDAHKCKSEKYKCKR